MASGKTTIGMLLAKALKFSFYDTDALIEQKMQMSVADIFENDGEEKFRTLETETLKQLLAEPNNLVIATGGGMIKKAENRKLLKDKTKVIFFDVSIPEQIKRTETDTTRPLLAVSNKKDKLEALKIERMPLYQAVAHLSIQVDGLTPTKIVEAILVSDAFRAALKPG